MLVGILPWIYDLVNCVPPRIPKTVATTTTNTWIVIILLNTLQSSIKVKFIK
jgi:hypothetical protein